MLRILGSPKRACDGLTRRDFLLASGLGSLSLGLPADASAAQPVDRGFGRAKNVILLYLFGGPSQLETFDPKPDAPSEVRGAMRAIATRVPGCSVCEGLPRVAEVMDRVTVIRSLTHNGPFHGMQYATSGLPQSTIPLEETQRHAAHWPFLGSVVTYFHQQQRRPKRRGEVPDNLLLPFLLSSQRPSGSGAYARPHAAYLGAALDPLCTRFRGKANRSMPRHDRATEAIFDPYLGLTADSRFELADETELPADLTLDRLNRRRSLLEQFDKGRRELDQSSVGRQFDHHRQQAFALLDSPRVRAAFDLGREPMPLREAYGMTLFGQGVLQARRLVEAGCRFVTVIWDEYGQAGSGWDTHADHFNRMKNYLLPGFDWAFSALLKDLEARGLLDETLVLVLNEMGRTPQLDRGARGGGRNHWSYAYSNVLAGAGVARGRVVGKTDKIASAVVERPLTAKDVLATAYHLLGLNADAMVPDRLNRPVSLLPYGEVIREVLA